MLKKEDRMDEVLARLRDWLQHGDELRQTIDGYLSQKVETQDMVVNKAYDLAKIEWVPKEGQSGSFELAKQQTSADYVALNEDLKAHKDSKGNCRMTVGEYFVWLFPKGDAIGRKPAKK